MRPILSSTPQSSLSFQSLHKCPGFLASSPSVIAHIPTIKQTNIPEYAATNFIFTVERNNSNIKDDHAATPVMKRAMKIIAAKHAVWCT
jgi:hypothetical protein